MEDVVETFLAHYGVKGMRWGVRRDRNPQKVQVATAPGKRVKVSGGKNQTTSPEAVRAAIIKQKAAKSTVDSLSNKELRELIDRMNLERQYNSLAGNDMGVGMKIGRTLVGNLAENSATAAGAKAAAKIFGLTGNIPITVIGAGLTTAGVAAVGRAITPKNQNGGQKKKK